MLICVWKAREMEIFNKEEQEFTFVHKEEILYLHVCVCVCTYRHMVNCKLFFGSNQFEAGRTKFPYCN